MRWPLLACALATAAIVCGRDAKWFLTRQTVTRYIFKQPEPSSCIVMEKSLKACRYLRHIAATATESPLMTRGAMLSERTPPLPPPPPPPQSPPPPAATSWSLLEPVTVTRTVLARTHTPAPVVTFSVRGCRPTRLPFDLDLCPSTDVDKKRD